MRKFTVLRAYQNREVFNESVYVLNQHLQQHGLARIISIVDGEFMEPHMKDQMTACGWTVVVEETERLLDPADWHLFIERQEGRVRQQ